MILSRTHVVLALSILVFLAGSRGAAAGKTPGPLPDNRTIDTFEYVFNPQGWGPSATFSVTRKGKVAYHSEWAPTTNSGGHVVRKEWEISPPEAVTLLRGLVDDGLLDLEDNLGGRFPSHCFKVSYGRWQLSAHPKAMPEPLMKRLRPYLEKADPEFWKAAP